MIDTPFRSNFRVPYRVTSQTAAVLKPSSKYFWKVVNSLNLYQNAKGDCVHHSTSALCSLQQININSQTGTVPDSWKLSLITPVPKHGKPDPNNYRPISLLPIVNKVLECIIFNKLCDQLSIFDCQRGFLPGRSTTGASLSAIQEWHLELERVAEIQAVLLDLQKAFDGVLHRLLFQKLIQLDVHPTLLLGLPAVIKLLE